MCHMSVSVNILTYADSSTKTIKSQTFVNKIAWFLSFCHTLYRLGCALAFSKITLSQLMNDNGFRRAAPVFARVG